MLYMCTKYHIQVNMYHVSAQGIDECMINVQYYYYHTMSGWSADQEGELAGTNTNNYMHTHFFTIIPPLILQSTTPNPLSPPPFPHPVADWPEGRLGKKRDPGHRLRVSGGHADHWAAADPCDVALPVAGDEKVAHGQHPQDPTHTCQQTHMHHLDEKVAHGQHPQDPTHTCQQTHMHHLDEKVAHGQHPQDPTHTCQQTHMHHLDEKVVHGQQPQDPTHTCQQMHMQHPGWEGKAYSVSTIHIQGPTHTC